MTLIRDKVLHPREITVNGTRIYTCLELSNERICVSISRGQNIIALYVLDLPAHMHPEIYHSLQGKSPEDAALEFVISEITHKEPELLEIPF